MRHSIIAVSVLAVAIALAGCGKKQPPMPTQAFAAPGVTFKLNPPAAPDCKPDTAYVATVSWAFDGRDAAKTEVRINKPDGDLFARSNDRTGHADTGKWVKPGMWFLLSDRKSGELLGAVQAGPKPCP